MQSNTGSSFGVPFGFDLWNIDRFKLCSAVHVWSVEHRWAGPEEYRWCRQIRKDKPYTCIGQYRGARSLFR